MAAYHMLSFAELPIPKTDVLDQWQEGQEVIAALITATLLRAVPWNAIVKPVRLQCKCYYQLFVIVIKN